MSLDYNVVGPTYLSIYIGFVTRDGRKLEYRCAKNNVTPTKEKENYKIN